MFVVAKPSEVGVPSVKRRLSLKFWKELFGTRVLKLKLTMRLLFDHLIIASQWKFLRLPCSLCRIAKRLVIWYLTIFNGDQNFYTPTYLYQSSSPSTSCKIEHKTHGLSITKNNKLGDIFDAFLCQTKMGFFVKLKINRKCMLVSQN